jgi:hypothetical protein
VPELDLGASGAQNASFGLALLEEWEISDALDGSTVFYFVGLRTR